MVDAVRHGLGISLEISDYSEHALGRGTDARAAAYVECSVPDGSIVFGVGIDPDVATASARAVISAANTVSKRQTAPAGAMPVG